MTVTFLFPSGPYLLHVWMGAAFWMTLLWGIHLKTRNAGWVDLGWVTSIAYCALAGVMLLSAAGQVTAVLIGMVWFWAGRLSAHLLRRLLKETEDPRYIRIREAWNGGWFFKSFLFFQFQGALALFLSMPFLVTAMRDPQSWTLWQSAGLAVWAVGLCGEAAADRSLARFRRDPANRGKVCEAGLWNFSRHPNYFFEWSIWVGYALFASGHPGSWVVWASPAAMLFLLLKVSGVPAAEAQSLASRGEAYRRYQRTTSVFVPWFKRSP